MRRILSSRRPSAAMIVATVALIMALAGTAVALVGLNAKQKKQVKNIATAVTRQASSWALVNAAGSSIIAQSGGISITGHAAGRTGLRFPGKTNTSKAAIVSQVTAYGVAGTQGGLFFSKAGPCPTATDCAAVGGTAKTDLVIDTFSPDSNFADVGTFVTLTK
jgi:hypothetical protein